MYVFTEIKKYSLCCNIDGYSFCCQTGKVIIGAEKSGQLLHGRNGQTDQGYLFGLSIQELASAKTKKNSYLKKEVNFNFEN